MVRLLLVVIPLAVLAGCRTESPDYCKNFPGMMGCPGVPMNGGTCSMNTDCTGTGFPICDTHLNDGTCVQCTDGVRDCGGALCVQDKCQPCTQHSQCPSHACLGSGICADASQVAYVRPNGSGMDCTDTAPCKTINDGLKAKSIVKVEGAITDMVATTIDGKVVTILATPGSTLTRSTNGVILDVKNDGVDVKVYDLEIAMGMGPKTDPAVSLSGNGNPKLTLTRVKVDNNQGIGIVAAAGTLTITQSTISENGGGGIFASGGSFDITNSFIITNGAPGNDPMATMPAFGGVLFNSPITASPRRFEFNTVSNNSSNSVTGVFCGLNMAAATFANNIVYLNQSGGSHVQFGGPGLLNCTWTYSDIGGLSPLIMGNMDMDPMFVDTTKDKFQLMSGSPVKDKADPAATITVDFDGDPRPTGKADIGADELPSQ